VANQVTYSTKTTSSGCVEVLTTTVTTRDGVETARNYHRHVIVPGQGYSSENSVVKTAAAAAHTSDAITTYNEEMAAILAIK
jgi:hypothetical protein